MCKSKTKEARLFLGKLQKLDAMIENKLIEKEQWKSIASGTTTQQGGERVQSSGSQQRMADAINRYRDIEAEIDACIDNLIDAKMDVIAVIEQLELDEYDVLHKMYVQYKTFYEVADMCKKSYSWVTHVHGQALWKVQKILDERKKICKMKDGEN